MTETSAAHLNEFQPLSIRYGYGEWTDETWADKQPWGQRHRSIRADANARPHEWCACPGIPRPRTTPCAMKVTQEDLLCDECRAWCVGATTDRRLVSMISVYGASS